MKRAKVLLVLSLLFLPSFMPVVMATPTLSQTGSESSAVLTAEDDSEDSDIFTEDWLYSFLDNVFGWDRQGRGRRYYYGSGGPGSGPGGGGPGFGPGGGGPGYGRGNGGPGNDNMMDTCPVQIIPAPGALVLGAIGLSFVSWLRRSRTL